MGGTRRATGARRRGAIQRTGVGLATAVALLVGATGCEITFQQVSPPPPAPLQDAGPAPDAIPDVPPTKLPDGQTWPDGKTSPPDQTTWQPPQGNFPPLLTDFAIGNATGQSLVVRVRALKPSVQIDCAKVAKAPTAWLSRPLFAPARTWQVDPGRAFAPVQPGDGPKGAACTALLVDGGGVPMRLFFWQHAEFPKQQVASTVAGAVGTGRLLQVVGNGSEFTWAKHGVSFVAPAQLAAGAAPGCGQPTAVDALAWSQPLPQGDQMVLDVQSAPNGCHFLELLGKLGTSKWMICVPPGAWPFEAGDEFFASPLQGGHNLGAIQGLDLLGDGKRLRFGRGADVVYLGNAEAKLQPLPDCSPGFDPCGSVISALQLTLQLPGSAAVAVVAGSALPMSKTTKAWLVRSFDAPVVDGACTADLSGGRLVESVFSEGAL